jgi:hypothetical protein
MWETMTRQENVGYHKNGIEVTWRTLAEDHDLSKTRAKKFLRDMKNDEIWTNNIYQVNVRRRTGQGYFDGSNEVYNGFPKENGEVAWLSIKRLDKEPIHDWRDLQQIKNEVVGEEAEAIEIYPAESRKMDVANQYHLFAFTTPIPIGFVGRAVESSDKAAQVGAKQRALL